MNGNPNQLSSIEEHASSFALHVDLLVRKTPPKKIELLNDYGYRPYDWHLSSSEFGNLSQTIYSMAKDIEINPIKISVHYNPTFKDIFIVITDEHERKLIKSYLSESVLKLSDNIDIQSIKPDSANNIEFPLSGYVRKEYAYGDLAVRSSEPILLFFTSVFDPTVSGLIKLLASQTEVPSYKIEEFISSQQPNEGKYIARFRYDKKSFTGEIYINDKSIKLTKGTNQYDIVQSILNHSNNLADEAPIDDIYEDIFGTDYYSDASGDLKSKKDKMYQWIHRVNEKIRGEAGIDFDVIIRDGDYYRLNNKIGIN